MQEAIEQAGSVFTGWISTCLFCLDSNGDGERAHHQQAIKQRGAEREMQICHSQPHLVPPMKLVVYDDLPSPGPPSPSSSFPSWIMDEGRNLVSRASIRASMSFRRRSTAPLRISAPTDFRVVAGTSSTLPTRALSTAPAQRPYRPLELSFQDPANRLPELPRFSDFNFDFGLDNDQPQAAAIARPPKAFSFMTDASYQSRPQTFISHTRQPSSSFSVPRKPVGSGSRRSSLATLELLMERKTPNPTPTRHPLIPHFSVRSSTASVATGLATITFPSPSPPIWLDSTVGVGSPPLSNNTPSRALQSHDATASASTIHKTLKPATSQSQYLTQSKSLPSFPIRNKTYERVSSPVDTGMGIDVDTQHHPFSATMPMTTPNLSLPPSRSSRVTQWLLQQTTAISTAPKTPTSAPPPTFPFAPPSSSSRKPSLSLSSSLSDKLSMRIRSRTLSGSTIAPSTPTVPVPVPVPAGAKTTVVSDPPSPPSRATTATARTSTLDSRIEKEFEIPGPYSYASTYPFPRQARSQTQSSTQPQFHPAPTIHEVQQQTNLNLDYYAYGHNHHPDNDHDHHRQSAIGVAF
ncbi:hypothetical protein AN6327.2 [Aspergillus nidulans FGSC A4]|uniref:Uncharacterized protein n=1 Tax=Emericella nidulans (strain FGSC A4 / ATCC 38163 / CBS 112.46 / NRRL 194 / M139) TaxID=227321 RepID=Q5AZF3_EMENI|nr:hypothetical protein [Aspergillus nidulans FGSC A4]EAA58711.1 hypothetical protein AN6327.2 [Aspergillus nidulans FGSC A4]CBF69693.1 TPA: hypothetical protein ANIA_06327 [Aspergillus nidulans FGSC A4]|eukprot:XP_663931.1 hypothetical protein AN6327.2 [Aspergillus nidulans FGSC A4]